MLQLAKNWSVHSQNPPYEEDIVDETILDNEFAQGG